MCVDADLVASLRKSLKPSRGPAPKVDNVIAALALARDAKLSAEDACNAQNIPVGSRDRISKLGRRILDEGLLPEPLSETSGHPSTGDAGRVPSPSFFGSLLRCLHPPKSSPDYLDHVQPSWVAKRAPAIADSLQVSARIPAGLSTPVHVQTHCAPHIGSVCLLRNRHRSRVQGDPGELSEFGSTSHGRV